MQTPRIVNQDERGNQEEKKILSLAQRIESMQTCSILNKSKIEELSIDNMILEQKKNKYLVKFVVLSFKINKITNEINKLVSNHKHDKRLLAAAEKENAQAANEIEQLQMETLWKPAENEKELECEKALEDCEKALGHAMASLAAAAYERAQAANDTVQLKGRLLKAEAATEAEILNSKLFLAEATKETAQLQRKIEQLRNEIEVLTTKLQTQETQTQGFGKFNTMNLSQTNTGKLFF